MRFADLILRRNIVRQVVDTINPLRTDASGCKIVGCERLIAENNVISDTLGNSALWFNNCGSVKFFNNQTSAGTLLRGYNNAAQRFTLELEDQVQDVLLPL